jgi:hypothetical protein
MHLAGWKSRQAASLPGHASHVQRLGCCGPEAAAPLPRAWQEFGLQFPTVQDLPPIVKKVMLAGAR